MGIQQAERLIVTSLSVQDHVQPIAIPQSISLPDGIHLRWFPTKQRGFPKSGYLVFRRPTSGELKGTETIRRITDVIEETAGKNHNTDVGKISSDEIINTVNLISDHQIPNLWAPNKPDAPEIPLWNRGYLLFNPKNWYAIKGDVPEPQSRVLCHRITLWLIFRTTDSIEVKIYSESSLNQRLLEARTIRGQAEELVEVTFEHDAISAVRLGQCDAVLAELEYQQTQHDSWSKIVSGPMSLPVQHPNFNGLTSDIEASWQKAKSRILPGNNEEQWREAFSQLHYSLQKLVENGGDGPRMKEIVGAIQAPQGGQAIENFPLLDWVITQSIDPIYAQMLGTYILDSEVEPNKIYDYLVVACHAENTNADELLQRFNDRNDFPPLVEPELYDAWIHSHVKYNASGPVDTPEPYAAFSLAWPDGLDRVGLARIHRNIQKPNFEFAPGKLNHFRLWRSDLGSEVGNSIPHDGQFNLLSMPSFTKSNARSQNRPPNWPPVPIDVIDENIKTPGWYAYKVSGTDIFGRHSSLSNSIPWISNEGPNKHPYAVHILDRSVPLPPTGIEVVLLDPADPYLERNSAYQNWQNSLPAGNENLCGVRIRWKWPDESRVLSPRAREFRIYFHENELSTGEKGKQREDWSERIWVHPISDYIHCGVLSRTGIRNGNLGQKNATLINRRQIVLPQSVSLKDIEPGKDHLSLPGKIDDKTFLIESVDVNSGRITLKEAINLQDQQLDWTIGQPYCQYEVFLPDVDSSLRDILREPSITERILEAHIGISTADNELPAGDDERFSGTRFGGRNGYESGVVGPVKFVRVRRRPPEAPAEYLPDLEGVNAKSADWYRKSFYSYRWRHQELLKTNIYRASDETIFNGAYHLGDNGAVAEDSAFPSTWEEQRVVQVKQELSPLANLSNRDDIFRIYRSLRNDALRVLAAHPELEEKYILRNHQPLNPDSPEHQNKIGLDNPNDYSVDPDERIYTDTLPGMPGNRYLYRASFVDPAGNASPKNLPGPPVSIPNIRPPRRPSRPKEVLSDGEISLFWASNREPDLAYYLIHRSSTERKDKDIQNEVMKKVSEGQFDYRNESTKISRRDVDPSVEPNQRPERVNWSDKKIQVKQVYWYRIFAVDSFRNISKPSKPLKTSCVDTRVPQKPAWSIEWVLVNETDGTLFPISDRHQGRNLKFALKILVESNINGANFTIARRFKDSQIWRAVTKNRASSSTETGIVFIDKSVERNKEYEYRSFAKSEAGIPSAFSSIFSPPPT